jgi:hypothetical protein
LPQLAHLSIMLALLLFELLPQFLHFLPQGRDIAIL